MTEKITFRIPGKVQYSYTEFTGTAEELGRINYEMAAALFASALYSVGSAERAAFARLQEGQTAFLSASEVAKEEELPEGAEELLKEELGAVKVDESEAPYKQPAPPAGAKPWEKKKPAATMSINIDDF